jgi:glutamine amidotransferase
MSAPLAVVVVDLGVGNLRSVERSLGLAAAGRGLDVRVQISAEAAAIGRADRVVVPGQGAFRDASRALAGGLGKALGEALGRGVPYLGICLGLQMLLEGSDEAPGEPGLGFFAGHVVRLLPSSEGGERAKVPHMGWNRLDLSPDPPPTLAEAAAVSPWFYFTHSFHAVPSDPSLIVARASHGGAGDVCAALALKNVLATQFHPEKSQAAGLTLLGAFLTQGASSGLGLWPIATFQGRNANSGPQRHEYPRYPQRLRFRTSIEAFFGRRRVEKASRSGGRKGRSRGCVGHPLNREVLPCRCAASLSFSPSLRCCSARGAVKAPR